MSAKRIAAGRAEELLALLMDVIATEGFASLKVSDLAKRLKCSTSTLYRIASSKESLVLVAVKRWAEASLAEMKSEADKHPMPAEKARSYYRATVQRASVLSAEFRADVADYESTARLYQDMFTRFAEQFAAYLDEATRVGEIRPFNVAFLAMLFQQIGLLVGNPAALERAGLTHEEAMREVDSLLWDGLLPRS